MSRIDTLFNKKKDEMVMSLFITAGFPTIEDTVDLILGFSEAGADMIELGIPFSDPLADGPTIQYASEVAIKNGITLPQIFDMVRNIRKKSDIPIVLMGYVNPVFNYGIDRFFQEAAGSGADGVILPDIPVDEADPFLNMAKKNNLDFIFLVAPNTSDQRMKIINSLSTGFVYCVSVTGVTGAREGDDVYRSVQRFKDRVKNNIDSKPRMVGFGIKSHDDAIRIAEGMNGFILGSALIDKIRSVYPENGWQDAVYSYIRWLKHG